MKNTIQRRLAKRKKKIERRLARKAKAGNDKPVLRGTSPKYELAERSRGTGVGGIGVIHRFAKKCGLIEAIDRRLKLLKIHKPYHESDHVLNIAYNVLCGGTCLDDIEIRRNDEVFLDSLGAERIPDPTTAGDFCRRFTDEDVIKLQDAIDEVRVKIWREQSEGFFEQAVIDMDGTLVETTGQCKEGMDISYKGVWGYHPLVVTLANTGEVLRLFNRPGNRPSHEAAWVSADQAIRVCREGGFRSILLRGDTDFTQAERLDGWNAEGVEFIFGVDAMPNLKGIADDLPENTWESLQRRQRRSDKEEPRRRPENVKEKIVDERGYKNLRLIGEDIAEFKYQPGKCQRPYRIVVVRKRIEEAGGGALIEGIHNRYFFYITNTTLPTQEVVFKANDRCDQENIIAQLKGGVRSLHAPVDGLVSNEAYMVMASLAWTLKAWLALSLPETGPPAAREKRRAEKRTVLRMKFKKFVTHFIRVPAQILRSGRRLVFRILNWNPWLPVFFRICEALRC